MKVLASVLLFAASVASADSAGRQMSTDYGYGSAQAEAFRRPEPCTPQKYSCGGGRYAEVDLCANGSYYLRGTDIPFQGCDGTDD